MRRDRDLVLAWHVEALRRQEKLPALKTLLSRGKRAEEQVQSVTQQRSVLAMLSEKYGIPLRKTRLIRQPETHGQ